MNVLIFLNVHCSFIVKDQELIAVGLNIPIECFTDEIMK